jgi:hypothetical protein
MSFKEQLEDDLLVFYNSAEFAVPALYKGNFIPVMFTEEFEVESIKQKMITVRTVDMPNIEMEDTMEINGLVYTVGNHEFKDETQLERVVGIWSQ